MSQLSCLFLRSSIWIKTKLFLNLARYLVHKRHSKSDHKKGLKRGAKFDIDYKFNFHDDDDEDPDDEDCDEDHTTDLPTASSLTSPFPGQTVVDNEPTTPAGSLPPVTLTRPPVSEVPIIPTTGPGPVITEPPVSEVPIIPSTEEPVVIETIPPIGMLFS